MKKRLTRIGIAVVLIFIIGMGIAGNYFYAIIPFTSFGSFSPDVINQK